MQQNNKRICGILLAGGTGSRLAPVTTAINKHFIPVYNKPLIYYSLSTLILAGIRDICVISNPADRKNFQRLLGDGSHLGVNISYLTQHEPTGIAQAPVIAENFIASDDFVLMLGDNILIGDQLGANLRDSFSTDHCVYCYRVSNSKEFGVALLNENGLLSEIVEKPNKTTSNWAVIGVYKYNADAIKTCKELKKSERGEYEITDLNNTILAQGKMEHRLLGRGFYWFDAGTFQGLHSASVLVRALEERQGYLLGSPEEASYNVGNISVEQLLRLCHNKKSGYFELLRKSVQ